MKEINYYKSNEILENRYYQVPQELFENPLYKDNLNSDSKILYGFLLDRLSLSQKNHWFDENKRVYLIFTREEVQNKLNLSDKTVTKAFKQLKNVYLVEEKRQGLGKPNLIYVGKIQHVEVSNLAESENLRFLNRNICDSKNEKNTNSESENLRRINTNNIKTNINNTDFTNPYKEDNPISLNEIKEKCELNSFSKKDQIILEDVIDTLYYTKDLKVGNVTITSPKILSKLSLINKNNLIQLLDIAQNNNIKNLTNYLMICLYNNLGNTNITHSDNSVLKYSTEFLNSLYANFV